MFTKLLVFIAKPSGGYRPKKNLENLDLKIRSGSLLGLANGTN